MKNIQTILLIIVTALATHFFYLYKQKPKEVIKKETIVTVDTITIKEIVRDTVFIKGKIVSLPKVIKDSIVTHDSIFVAVPIQKYEFKKDSVFFAEITGYDVQIKKFDIYPKTIYKNITTTQYIKQKKRWAIGIQAGYGFTSKKATPYIGVGINYNLIFL